ncbi:Zn(2)-C6 fungal-type DNA-binding domain protein [Beauveria brongniartii RCEF 3172]|uniref:Zn(2)-C6 fungal-type DNA-binding domain protein n=1 Tax=Beauveria brongniartii RCEF 3172 TaxID=1081107 RepID=A0A166WEJ2_9HYPO|nr:Zn(2)-C6 fungal-type DNA-binding domain protein [Beauveria brongniartii RCEF 3172]
MVNRPRLKRCCDACRASKVRCEGQKPSCKRCIQSQYSCIYSLSGKVGRPSHKQALRQQNTPLQGLPSPSEGNSRIESVLNTPISTSINVAETCNNITATSTSEDASENMTDVSLDSILLADGGATGSELWAECILPSIDPPSTHSVPFSGCATAIANAQSDAESLCRRLRLPDMATDSTTQFRSISTISRQLSIILTCPCSMQSEIGLGVATACLAILDAYRAILRQMMGNTSWMYTQQQPNKGPQGIAMVFLQEVHTFSNVVNQFKER